VPYKAALDEAQFKHSKDAQAILQKALLSGKYQPGPIKVLPNGLNSVAEGFELHKTGKVSSAQKSATQYDSNIDIQVSGEKIIYRISDTNK
jgi:hypothetical protein